MNISICGAGAWGTALAISACAAGHSVRLWARDGAFALMLNAGLAGIENKYP